MKRILIAACAALAALVALRSARAATAQSTLTVNATVPAICIITPATLNFGTYDPVGVNAAPSANLDATATVTVACTKGSNYWLGLNTGANASGATRRMKANAADYLTYELYQDSGRTTVWGNTTGTAPAAVTAGTTGVITLTVYGRVAGGQTTTPSGAFTDTVQSTINF